MTLRQRIDNYMRQNPRYSPLIVHNNRIYGFWLIGRWYATNPNFYGSYPPSYLTRVMSLFADCSNILHLFSGTVKAGLGETTYDIKPELGPDVCDDVRHLLDHFSRDEFDLILADPPYEQRDFEKYGLRPFNKAKVVKDCAVITRPGGFLVWLDTMLPSFSKKQWQLMGIIGLVQSTNHRTRAVSMFQKPELG